jgi:hypothetical protein
MRPRLLFPDHDLDEATDLPEHAEDVAVDLGLDPLVSAMAGSDAYLGDVAQQVLLSPVTDPDVIAYRQAALRDCLANPQVTEQLYGLAMHAMDYDDTQLSTNRYSVYGLLTHPTTPVLGAASAADPEAVDGPGEKVGAAAAVLLAVFRWLRSISCAQPPALRVLLLALRHLAP